MLVEFGHFGLILAFVFVLLQVGLSSVGLWQNNHSLMQLSKPLVWGQFIWLLIAFLVLTNAFLSNDFSVLYVANNSNTLLPTIYKISGVWGAHEGSLLLWGLILSVWTLAVSLFSKQLPPKMLVQILVMLGVISIGFLAFLLFTSNPFERNFPIPLEGRELNPLLQDFGLAIHPPMLYMGYVGLAVPFAFVLSALVRGRLDSTWIKWSRPWTLVAWMFLTIGIVLGSWWAYYELGWGGWWFWDPVENASFMPWLVATALVHSLSVSQKRAAFKHWTVLLAIGGFSLSLLGTFLVRSGVLTSVHSFASDPARGLFILIFLIIVIGTSFALYAYRAPLMKSENRFSPLSRESGLLMNNILLSVAMFAVLLGTLYPLLLDALSLGKISVGAPYFDLVFIPIMAPAVVLLAIAPFLRWKQDSLNRSLVQLRRVWLLIFVLIVLLAWFFGQNLATVIAASLFTWVVVHSLVLLFSRIRQKQQLNTAFLGMIIAHIGIAVFVLGATITTQHGVERDVKLDQQQQIDVGGYQFIFNGVSRLRGENYQASVGDITVFKAGEFLYRLRPEKRHYQTGQPMTEAAIKTRGFSDIYVALGEDLGSGAWSVRIYYKPLVRFIWLGGLLIALGALLAAIDRRYSRTLRFSTKPQNLTQPKPQLKLNPVQFATQTQKDR